ncbi:MAG: aldo/keto reductase [bacterium]|nr:aldo/keto reductase [bacterium]
MEKRTLGSTGLEVTVVGFGAMTIGGIFGPVDDNESNRALHAAIDNGMNFIDTSDAYGTGHSETVIGKFLKERSDRGDIIIFTKGGNNMVTGQYNFTPEYIESCLNGSLQRLGIERIDLYLLHNPKEENMAAEDSYALLEKAKDAGKIKHWGVSLNTDAECDAAIGQGRPAVFQMEYNVLQQSPAGPFKRAKSAGMGVISRVPLKRGFLSGRIDEAFEFAEGDRRKGILSPENIRKFQGKLDLVQEVAAHMGVPAAEVALRFCVSNPDVSCVIPGIRTPEQSAQNAKASTPLPADALKRLLG